jgi:NAD(P)-dependent dehydrogenase (short-subunit alcohol dehydrogenase family)
MSERLSEPQEERKPSAFITGASRGIGAETARALGRRGWDVALGLREKEKKVNAVVDSINKRDAMSYGPVAEAFKGDITDPTELENIVSGVSHWATELNSLVLNAAGGLEKGRPPDYAMRINRDAQVALVEGFTPIMMPDGSIVYITSHWAHLYGQVDTPPFEYEAVASTKNAGESALKDLMPFLSERELRLIIVSGGLVTGTFVGDYAVRYFPEFTEKQREIGNVVSAEEMGERIATVISDNDIPSGHIEVVGASFETLLEQSGLEK